MMIVCPGARQYPMLRDFVFEFKLQQASQQLLRYRQILTEKYQQPQRLICLAVVALGFERLVWQRL
jgi:hypothetical protein